MILTTSSILYLDNVLSIDGSPSNRTWRRLGLGTNQYIQNVGVLNNLLLKLKDSIGFNGPLFEGVICSRNAINERLYFGYLRKVVDDKEVENARMIPLIITTNDLRDYSKHNLFFEKFITTRTTRAKIVSTENC